MIGRRLLEVVRVPAIVEMIDHCLANKGSSEQTIEVGSASRYLHFLVIPFSESRQCMVRTFDRHGREFRAAQRASPARVCDWSIA